MIGFRTVPSYIEYFTVKKVMRKTLQDAPEPFSLAKFRSDFDLKASADYIDSVRGSDIDVVKEGNALRWRRLPGRNKLHMVGNVSSCSTSRPQPLSKLMSRRLMSTDSRSAGHAFRRPELLRQALTHRSFGADHNERLEFIGDSILNCAIALALYRRFPQLPEGELSRDPRQPGQQGHALPDWRATLDLGSAIRLGEGELRSGGAARPSILADALEAIFGAIFLDGGFDAARRRDQPDLRCRDRGDRSYGAWPRIRRRACRNGCRAASCAVPEYVVADVAGEAHLQTFDVVCRDSGARYFGDRIGSEPARRRAGRRGGGLRAGATGAADFGAPGFAAATSPSSAVRTSANRRWSMHWSARAYQHHLEASRRRRGIASSAS